MRRAPAGPQPGSPRVQTVRPGTWSFRNRSAYDRRVSDDATTAPVHPSSLPRTTPSAAGVDSAGVERFLDAVAAHPEVELHSLVVVKDAAVVTEGWWAPYGPERRHLLYSLSKSFTSTALGFAVAEGLVDLDATVLSYFPELDADVTDPRSRSILVRHVAAMASGHLADTVEQARLDETGDLLRGFLRLPPEQDPGSVFAYNQPCTFALSAIVQRVSGRSLTEFLRPRLLDPLGIGETGWLTDDRGREIGFSGFHATTEAIAKLGLLHLQEGVFGGQRLLPAQWVAEATRAHVVPPWENPDWSVGYGFQFWMARHGYRGDGAYGQFCLVLPEAGAVVAITSQSPDMQAVVTAVWDHLLPALTAGAGTAAAEESLRARLASAALAGPQGGPAEFHAGTFSAAAGNDQPGLAAVEVRESARGAELVLHEGGRDLVLALAPQGWVETDAVLTSATTGPAGLLVDLVFVETPHRLHLVLDAATGEFTARWATSPLHGPPLADLRMPR